LNGYVLQLLQRQKEAGVSEPELDLMWKQALRNAGAREARWQRSGAENSVDNADLQDAGQLGIGGVQDGVAHCEIWQAAVGHVKLELLIDEMAVW
jgi:hypothetical protein